MHFNGVKFPKGQWSLPCLVTYGTKSFFNCYKCKQYIDSSYCYINIEFNIIHSEKYKDINIRLIGFHSGLTIRT